ncbi:MAG: hypothetical protein EBY16_00765 [Gammaproteobacteria bacterium]|nr:hypothetical protein [Gammaproteobacteria bacterium]
MTEDNGEKSRRSKGEVNIVPTLGAIAVSDKSIIAVEPTKEYLHAHPKLHLKSSNGSKSSSDHFRKKLADGKLNPQPSSLSKAQKEDDNEDKKNPPSATR